MRVHFSITRIVSIWLKMHVHLSGCSGKRRRTDFVPLDAFTERHLRSDIQLLEEVQRAEQLAARERPGGVPRHPPQWAKELHGEVRRHLICFSMAPSCKMYRGHSGRQICY